MTDSSERPAFPEVRMNTVPGMTLREWYAGQALIGLMSGGAQGGNTAAEVADNAFKLADAMVAQSKES